jgi:beta-ureidopropionase
VLQAFRFNADKEHMRQPRIVRVGLVQNSIAVPTTCHFADQKKAIMEKVKLIIDAAGASGVNVLCLQVLIRLAIQLCSLETRIYIFKCPNLSFLLIFFLLLV